MNEAVFNLLMAVVTAAVTAAAVVQNAIAQSSEK